jgi:hypothetical protein
MRFSFRFILLLLICPLAGSLAQEVNQLFSLSITAPQESVTAGSEVRVKTKLTNISNRTLTIIDAVRDCDYPVEVRDSNGKLAPKTDYAAHLKCEGAVERGRNIVIELKPQESREDELVIASMYDLSRPGTYLIQVFRKLPQDLGGDVKSNTFTVNVTK